ncbi:MAG: hypothetical protein GXP51_00865 [Deltaproteobacteria bacterium]|nr:hypothetical protein [Deltaproteobacteria bacterium]
MTKQNNLLRTGFALFSAVTSFIFVYYAVSIVTVGNTPEGLKFFAYVAGGYGLLNIYILSWAWRSQAGWTVSANMVIAVSFFGVVIMDLLRAGLQGSMQIVGILGLALVLAVNWFTVKILCQSRR